MITKQTVKIPCHSERSNSERSGELRSRRISWIRKRFFASPDSASLRPAPLRMTNLPYYVTLRYFLFVGSIFFFISCGGKPSLNSDDTEYVRTTLDLLRTRANFTPTEDSTSIKRSLDSVYRRHHTSAADYQAQTLSFSDDHDRVSAIFAAINDSIGK